MKNKDFNKMVKETLELNKRIKNINKQEVKNRKKDAKSFNSKNINPTLKKQNKIVKTVKGSLIFVGALLSSGIIFREAATSIEISNSNYNNVQEIDTYAGLLNANMTGRGVRGNGAIYPKLKHNGSEPIYVLIEQDLPESYKSEIVNSFNYIENFMKDINASYNFKFTNSSEILGAALRGKTVMVFNKVNTNEFNGKFKGYHSVIKRDYANIGFISLNDRLKSEHVYPTVLHETLHMFGFVDYYSTVVKTDNYETYMKVNDLNLQLRGIYPNDYAMIYAVYGDFKNQNGELSYEKLDKAKQNIATFESDFYNIYVGKLESSKGLKYKLDEIKNFDIENKTFEVENKNVVGNARKLKFEFKENGKVEVEVPEQNGLQSIIKTYNYKVVDNNKIVVPSVYFTNATGINFGAYSSYYKDVVENVLIFKDNGKWVLNASSSNQTHSVRVENSKMPKKSQTMFGDNVKYSPDINTKNMLIEMPVCFKKDEQEEILNHIMGK